MVSNMGLDNFTTEKSGFSGNKRGGNRNTTVSHGDEHNAYKIIWNGDYSIPIESNEIVVQTEEEWEKIILFINDDMNISTKDFNSKSKERKYNIVEKAVECINGNKREMYSKKRDCMVCEKEFNFPEDWNFVEFDDFICCSGHKISDVMKEYNADSNAI